MIFSGHQPNFLPYMGFFYKMMKSDVFVLDDDVQYSHGEWHNSNFIKLAGKKSRITVPVSYDFGDAINQVEICYARDWRKKLLRSVKMYYARAAHAEEGIELIERHLMADYELLAELNIALIKEIAERFGIEAKLLVASVDMPTKLKNNDRNIHQCWLAGADTYYSGNGGKAYNDEQAYKKAGIKIVYTDYEPVVYQQTKGDFIENLSVLDYILNNGFVLPKEWKR